MAGAIGGRQCRRETWGFHVQAFLQADKGTEISIALRMTKFEIQDLITDLSA